MRERITRFLPKEKVFDILSELLYPGAKWCEKRCCMVKKIRLFGMEIDNFSLREEILQGEDFYNKTELNVIRTISMNMLSMAAENQIVRDAIAKADLLVVGDREILLEAGIYSSQRLREADEYGFMKEYLKRTTKKHSRVFLVAATPDALERLQQFIKSTYETLQIVGNYATEHCGGEYDSLVNEMNAAQPDMILSVVESPVEDEILQEERTKIDARVWYSLGASYRGMQERLSFRMRFLRLVHKERFKNAVHNYEDRRQ